MRKAVHKRSGIAIALALPTMSESEGIAKNGSLCMGTSSLRVFHIMYELKIITSFSAAHQLRNFQGACEHLHGHNWKIEVSVTSDTLNEAGIVVDFTVLKKHVNAVVAGLDHKFLNNLDPFKDQNPSSENIARYVAEQLAPVINSPDIKVSRVAAWESETSCATYYPP